MLGARGVLYLGGGVPKMDSCPGWPNWSDPCQTALFARKELLGSFRRRCQSIAQSAIVAPPETALLSLALARLDQMLEATRSLRGRFAALGATIVALHPQLVFPLARNR